MKRAPQGAASIIPRSPAALGAPTPRNALTSYRLKFRSSLSPGDLKSCFAELEKTLNVANMENPDQALEEARRAGIDLDLLDSNLALTYEQRALRHESALELFWALREAGGAYEKPARPVAEVR